MYMDFKHKILKCVVFNIWIYVCVRACMLSRFSHVQLFTNPWTVAPQAPLPMETLQARILERVAMLFLRGSSWPRNRTRVPCWSWTAGRFFTAEPTGKPRKCLQRKVWVSDLENSKLLSDPDEKPVTLSIICNKYFDNKPKQFSQLVVILYNLQTFDRIMFDQMDGLILRDDLI